MGGRERQWAIEKEDRQAPGQVEIAAAAAADVAVVAVVYWVEGRNRIHVVLVSPILALFALAGCAWGPNDDNNFHCKMIQIIISLIRLRASISM